MKSYLNETTQNKHLFFGNERQILQVRFFTHNDIFVGIEVANIWEWRI